MAGADRRAVCVVVRGEVQGVGFRAFVARAAGVLGLAGFVRNVSDGSVEAVFAGPDAAVGAAIAACRRGPPASDVVDVAVSPFEGPEPEGFRVLPSQ